MRPIQAHESLVRRTGGIQGCLLEEESPGIWTGEMVSRAHLQDITSAGHGVQCTIMGTISESVMVVGSRGDAMAALELVRQASGGGCVMLSPTGYPMLKGLGLDLHGKPRAPDMGSGGYK